MATAVAERPGPLHEAIAASLVGLVGKPFVRAPRADDHEIYLTGTSPEGGWLGGIAYVFRDGEMSRLGSIHPGLFGASMGRGSTTQAWWSATLPT